MKRERPCRLLFVYGTLMRGGRGFPGWRGRLQARCLGAAQARGRLYDFGAYPAAVFDPAAGSPISGELYRLGRPQGMPLLDAYEGPLFARARVEVQPESGPPVIAWAYALARPAPSARLIAAWKPRSSAPPPPRTEPGLPFASCDRRYHFALFSRPRVRIQSARRAGHEESASSSGASPTPCGPF